MASFNFSNISPYLIQAVADFERRNIKKCSLCFGLVEVCVLGCGTDRLKVMHERNRTVETSRKNSMKEKN
jgi:Fe-S-cluster-containing hydrogenase component 2